MVLIVARSSRPAGAGAGWRRPWEWRKREALATLPNALGSAARRSALADPGVLGCARTSTRRTATTWTPHDGACVRASRHRHNGEDPRPAPASSQPSTIRGGAVADLRLDVRERAGDHTAKEQDGFDRIWYRIRRRTARTGSHGTGGSRGGRRPQCRRDRAGQAGAHRRRIPPRRPTGVSAQCSSRRESEPGRDLRPAPTARVRLPGDDLDDGRLERERGPRAAAAGQHADASTAAIRQPLPPGFAIELDDDASRRGWSTCWTTAQR